MWKLWKINQYPPPPEKKPNTHSLMKLELIIGTIGMSIKVQMYFLNAYMYIDLRYQLLGKS